MRLPSVWGAAFFGPRARPNPCTSQEKYPKPHGKHVKLFGVARVPYRLVPCFCSQR